MDNKGFSRTFAAVLLLAMLVTSCSTVPETGRKQLTLMSDTELAKKYKQVFDMLKAQNPISYDPRMNEWVTEVSFRISQQVFWDMPLADWEFVVFDDPSVNAFAMAGGKVGVSSGLFKIVETKDELASVIAHEIAHVTARHPNEGESQQAIMRSAATISSIGTAVATSGMVNVGSSLMPRMNGWSRAKESEADRIGIMYMARAGYDPNAAVSVLEKLAKEYGENAYVILDESSHPPPGVRILDLQEYLPEAVMEYEKAKELAF